MTHHTLVVCSRHSALAIALDSAGGGDGGGGDAGELVARNGRHRHGGFFRAPTRRDRGWLDQSMVVPARPRRDTRGRALPEAGPSQVESDARVRPARLHRLRAATLARRARDPERQALLVLLGEEAREEAKHNGVAEVARKLLRRGHGARTARTPVPRAPLPAPDAADPTRWPAA